MSQDNDVAITSPQKLKSLVEALDLMNEEEDWIPSAKAWKRIKSMIETLEETNYGAPQKLPGPTKRQPAASHVNRLPRGPNPAETGNIAFPAVPVGDAAVLPDGPAAGSSLAPVANPAAPAVSSTDELPANPPSSPGL